MDEDLASFVGITGASDDAARQVLEMCAGDIGQAIQLWFSDEELQRNLTNPAATTRDAAAAAESSSSRSAPPVPQASRPTAGREDASGVIHIDSDDDEEEDSRVRGGGGGVMDLDDDEGVVEVARTAQEDEDAAMAQRLQQELYQGQAADEEGVRAPMARTTETLVAPSGDWGMEPHAMGDMDAAIEEQLRRRRRAGEFPSMAGGPGSHELLLNLHLQRAHRTTPSHNPYGRTLPTLDTQLPVQQAAHRTSHGLLLLVPEPSAWPSYSGRPTT